MTLPNLDLLLHNLVGLCVGIVVLMLLSQIIVSTILRNAGKVLNLSLFKSVTAEDRAAFNRRVRRGALRWTALLAAILSVASAYATYRERRALNLAKQGGRWLIGDDLATLGVRLLTALLILLGAIATDTLVKGIVAGLAKLVSRSETLVERRETLANVFTQLRKTARVVVLCVTANLLATRLDASPGTQHTILLASYVLGAFYGARLVVGTMYLLVDVLFDNSTRLAKLESPLKYLGNLQHIAPITRRVVDYAVYLSAATWIAATFTPDSWLAQAGRIGVRIIGIFYTSRVLVELCILLVDDLFLKVDESDAQTLQQRKTLAPVAIGFLRYSIYFSALVMALREASIDPTPLLAGAGVIGVAIGFGAQTFVGDIVAGFFILFENLLLVGDLVEVGGIQGRVEEIGVRITRIRDESGVLHSIPNGEVRKVANHSRAYVNAVIDVHVPYEEDLRRVSELLVEVTSKELEALMGAPGKVEVNVEELTEGSVMLRVLARVPPGESKDMGDVLRGRVVEELTKAKVSAPRPRRAVIIESRLRVGDPPPLEIEESEPLQPFSPSEGD